MDIIPSFYNTDGYEGGGGAFENTTLRPGEIQEILYPDDPRNLSKRFIEYRVYVQHRENGTAVVKMYENCMLLNSLGGRVDKLTYTLRADSSSSKSASSEKVNSGLGSKVLLLCVNGETSNAVIIGGLRDDKDDKDSKDAGHNLHFSFNGVECTIDKEGQLTLQVSGPTDAEGNANGSGGLPSTVKVEKDGTISASTGGASISIGGSGAITIKADKNVEINCFNAKINAKLKATISAPLVELGGEGVAPIPPNGVVLGSHVDTITGLPLWMLGASSLAVFAKKNPG